MTSNKKIKKDLPKSCINTVHEGKFGKIEPDRLNSNLINHRVVSEAQFGTIKYVGGLPESSGVWLGIDWDDQSRGRHDGRYKGIQYFETMGVRSGSFVRAGLVDLGLTVEEAVMVRYGGDAGEDGYVDEEFYLGSSGSDDECGGGSGQGGQKVKVHISGPLTGAYVSRSGIGGKDSGQSLDRLKSAVLHSLPVSRCMWDSGGADGPLRLGELCPALEELDIAQSLFSDWREVARACQQLPRLYSLNVSDNRLQPLRAGDDGRWQLYHEAFSRLTSLVLVRLHMPWEELLALLEHTPRAEHLCLAYNQLPAQIPASLTGLTPLLGYLDLAANLIDDAQTLVAVLGPLPALHTLLLNDNLIPSLCLPGRLLEPSPLFPALRLLAVSNNRIDAWHSVHHLARLPALAELIFMANPLLDLHSSPETARQDVIANLPRVRTLNRNEVKAEERRGAEIDYLKRYGQGWLQSRGDGDKEVAYEEAHPRYGALVARHGAPEVSEVAEAPRRLRERLIEVQVRGGGVGGALRCKVPTHMTVQHLRVLLRRLCKLAPSTEFDVAYVSAARPTLEIPLEHDTRELGFYSVQAGDTLVVRLL